MVLELGRFSMASNGSGDVLDGTTMAVNTLDPLQRKAATGTGNIQLVLAGPGSGKTTTLAGRFVHLVRQGIDRRRILALTFTKKAADEMRSRIATALDLPSAPDLSIATFHGFDFRHLRRNPQLAGLSDNFPLWDTAQQRHVFSSRRMWWNEETDILDVIAGAKERLVDAAGLAAEMDQDDEMLGRAVEFFRVYESSLRDAGAIDFADMVPLAPWRRAIAARNFIGFDYAGEHRNKPQTVSFALTDNPLATAAWIVEKLKSWSDSDSVFENGSAPNGAYTPPD